MAKNSDDINLRRLINIGKDKGYITYQELNEDLSDDVISSEEIDDLLQMFEDLNIKVVSEPAVGKIEKEHEERYLKLLKNLQEDKIFKKEEKMVWECGNCGHLHEGAEAPEMCPVCDHPRAHFKIQAKNY